MDALFPVVGSLAARRASAAGEAFSRSLMQRYRVSLEARALAPRTINLRLAAVRKLAEEAARAGMDSIYTAALGVG